MAYCQQAHSQVAKLYPVDEASRDPSFSIFRARLLEAIRQRDTVFILSVLSPAITNSFGGNGGIAEFKETWKLERPDSELWKTLTSVLALGGSFEGNGVFMAPYTYSKFPEKFDAFEYGVVIGGNVRVRQQPSQESLMISLLSYDIVRVIEWKPKEKSGNRQIWVAVALANGLQGYIADEYIRSPIDYRAIFEKKNGRWVMKALVAGD